MSVAVIPIKSLAHSKSRLASEFSRSELETLSLSMLDDLLGSLLATPALTRVAVATPDDRVAELARSLGAEALHGPDPGLKSAIDGAPAKLGLKSEEALLVVLGDLPDARPDELQRLFDAIQDSDGPVAALAPSSDGGTSALLRKPHDCIPSCFGAKSALRHSEAAEAEGVPLLRIPLPSLDLDLDSAMDLDRFWNTDGRGLRTRETLSKMGWPR